MKGKIINEFVGLKPQMYSLIKIDVEENENEKGDDKNVVKNTRHKEHVDVLFNKKIRDKIKRIQKKNYIESELMMFVKFLCLISMIKDTY